jgi:putative hydrolase of the HAD superfamily
MPSPVQAVSFDLWQTLMHDNKEQAQQRAALRAGRMNAALARAGFGTPPREVEDACRDIWQEWETRYWSQLVDPGFDAQIAWLCQRFGVPVDAEQLIGDLRAGYVEPVFALPPKPDPAALRVLTELQAQGLKLGLICNTSVTPGFALRRLLAGWGLEQLLTVQLFSDEVGIRKPAPAIYQQAARQLGVDISAMVHVGDRLDVDVEGAIAAGARGLQVGPDMELSDLALQLRQIEV